MISEFTIDKIMLATIFAAAVLGGLALVEKGWKRFRRDPNHVPRHPHCPGAFKAQASNASYLDHARTSSHCDLARIVDLDSAWCGEEYQEYLDKHPLRDEVHQEQDWFNGDQA